MISKGNHVIFARFVLLAVSEEAKTWLKSFRSMYNKTIIRWGFCDIHNNRGLSKGCQPQPLASADNPYLGLWLFWISQKPHLIIVYNRVVFNWVSKVIRQLLWFWFYYGVRLAELVSSWFGFGFTTLNWKPLLLYKNPLLSKHPEK